MGVVMAAYNSEPFVAAALESLRAQTLTDWRCVVIDDGSSDATAAEAQRVADTDERIRVIRTANGGVSAARNRGLAALDPACDTVSFLDSDDLLLPAALAVLHGCLAARPDAVGVRGLAEFIDADGRALSPGLHSGRQLSRRAARGPRLVDVDAGRDIGYAELVVDAGIWPSAVGLHRRAVIDAVGGFDPSFSRQEDWDLYVRMGARGAFAVVDEQVARYRRHTTNLTDNTIENCYQRDRVRWHAARSSPGSPHRRTIARAARWLTLADEKRLVARLRCALAARRWRSVALLIRAIADNAVTVVGRNPPRPSLRRVRWTRPTAP